MKTVFKSGELAHIWAQQNHEHGKNPQGNFYFEGKTIYSYGGHFPIATFVAPGVVVLTTRGYSNTTSKHIWATRDAVSQFKVFRAPNVPRYPEHGSPEHTENLESFIKGFPVQQKAAIKARKYPEVERNALVRDIQTAVEYAKYFRKFIISKKALKELAAWKRKADKGLLFSDKETAQIKVVIKEETAAAKIRNAERRKADAERAAQRAIDDARRAAERARTAEENLALWLKGETVNAYSLPDGVHLRIKDEAIETTRGATVPLIEARKFWHTLQRREDVVGMRLGHYTVDSIDGETLTVGCHNIPVREVVRMARALKWANDDGATLEVLK